jgi:hypothetical protein
MEGSPGRQPARESGVAEERLRPTGIRNMPRPLLIIRYELTRPRRGLERFIAWVVRGGHGSPLIAERAELCHDTSDLKQLHELQSLGLMQGAML